MIDNGNESVINLIYKYDLIATTESALQKPICDDDIKHNGFIPIRRDLPEHHPRWSSALL